MPQLKTNKALDRVTILETIKTPLGFFVLVVLVVEVALGGLATATAGLNQLTALCGMLFVILALIAVVAFLAYRRPEALRGQRPMDVQVGPKAGKGLLQLLKFCNRISGYWWERIKPEEPSAISFVEVSPDAATATVRMKGRAYGRDGNLAAIWETTASCVNLNERKVFYQWKGWHPLRPKEPYEGFGEISFPESLDNGVGVFLDTNLTDWASTTRKSVEFVRSSEQDVRVMQADNFRQIAELIQSKLGSNLVGSS